MTIETFMHFFSSTGHVMELLLFVLIAVSALGLVLMHFNPKSPLNLMDLVSVMVDGVRRLDEKKFTRFGAWVVSTWGFTYMVVEGKLTEWYYMGYMSVWVMNVLVDKFVSAKTTPPAAPVDKP